MSETCADKPHEPSSRPFTLRAVYESLIADCVVPTSVEIEAHPVALEGGPEIDGTTLVISLVEPARVVADVVLDRDIAGRRIYIDDEYCTRS